MPRPRSVLALVLLAAGARAQETPGFRPDETWTRAAEGGVEEIRPNTIYSGTFGAPREVDEIAIRLEADAVVSLGWFADPGIVFGRIEAPSIRRSIPMYARSPTILLRYRVGAGRHLVRMESSRSSAAGGYRFLVQADPVEAGWETEPNDSAAERVPLAIGEPARGLYSSWGDQDRWLVTVTRRTIFRLTVKRSSAALELTIWLGDRDTGFGYAIDLPDQDAWFFYPVLDPGDHVLIAVPRGSSIGSRYDLLLEPFEVADAQADEAEARRAIDRGMAWLLERHPSDEKRRRERVSHLGLSLLAIIEGGPTAVEETRRREVGRHLEALSSFSHEAEGGSWAGAPVRTFDDRLYGAAIATLALAEAVALGHEEARAPCEEGVRFLLASQLSIGRSEAWGRVESGPHRGGWRYAANSTSGDLSVTGWCLIALYAADGASVDVPGLHEAFRQGLEFVRGCADSTVGFRYQPDVFGRPTSVQQSIGALLEALEGSTSMAGEIALADLDRHLCAGTQTGHGDDSPFYYFYYATRAHFLRGGFPWEAWRRTTIRQLVHRQREDGSWDPIRKEEGEGERFATAMAVMVLRLCLNEAPAYLRRDVEGF